MIMYSSIQRRLVLFALALAMGALFCVINSDLFAQAKSYEDRLNQITQNRANASLGTISSQDKEEMKKRELIQAYSYSPQNNFIMESKATLDVEYADFRKKHNIPAYVGDEAVKSIVKNAKSENTKEEAVTVLETEKLLYDSFNAYHQEKDKMKLDERVFNVLGRTDTKNESRRDEEDMATRMDIIGHKSSGILQSSLQKLTEAGGSIQGSQYMASGGRAFPTINIEEDKDLVNVRGHIQAKVQKELLAVMANSINEFYHKEEGETAKEEFKNKDQLLAFVRVEEKAVERDKAMGEKIQTLERLLERTAREKYMEGERTSLNSSAIQELKTQVASMREQPDRYGKTLNQSALNKLYRELEKAGAIDPDQEQFRRGVSQDKLSPEEHSQFMKDMDAWDKSRNHDSDNVKKTSPGALGSRDSQWMPGDTRTVPAFSPMSMERQMAPSPDRQSESNRQREWPAGDPCAGGGCQ